MQQVFAVFIRRLEGVPECVAKIEQLAHARLGFIFHHDGRLRGARARNRIAGRFGFQRQNLLAMLCQPVEERRVIDEAVFHDLGIACLQLPFRQGSQQRGIRNHETRLIESADQVLAARGIHRRLSAHRRIHLRQQCGRHLHETHAALHQAGRQPAHVSDHAAAECNQRIAPVRSARQQPVQHTFEVGEALGLLARRQAVPVKLDAGGLHRRFQRTLVMAHHCFICQHKGTGPLEHDRQARAEFRQRAMPHQNIIRSRAQIDTHRFQRRRSVHFGFQV